MSVDYAPTIDEVAALIPSRARAANGRISTFDETTQPTGDQVQSIIDRSGDKLEAKFGEPVDALKASAKDVIALRAAMLVELTYFADQIRADRSPYQELKQLYEEAVTDFLADRSKLGADGTPGTADDQRPYWWFPPTNGIGGAPGSEIPCDPQEPVW